MKTLAVTVIISTYNSEAWLAKVLTGYSVQTYENFEVIVADDGSGPETKALIDRFAKSFPVPLRHIWHEDQGYRRQRILNQAIVAAANPYVLFTDGDCIPRPDFLEVHVQFAEKGFFLSGGYCKLSMYVSEAITEEDIKTSHCFKPSFLSKMGPLGGKQRLKLSAGKSLANILDFTTPTGATFNNCNSSAWKEDLLAINGYDERMRYGGPDRELGERLVNLGIKSKQIRYRAICLHLDHARGYKTKESLQRNLNIRKQTKTEKIVRTPYGITQNNAEASS